MTAEVLQRCLPKASRVKILTFSPHLANAMSHYHINTLERQAAFIAQLAHESGSLRYVEEIASGDAYDTRTDLGNTPEVDGDGRKWKGHGLFQVTGYNNHLAAARHFGKSIDEIADWLMTPGGASWSAGWFWSMRSLNAIADKDKLWRGTRGRYKNLDKFEYISVVINGGLNGMADRKKHYNIARIALGLPL